MVKGGDLRQGEPIPLVSRLWLPREDRTILGEVVNDYTYGYRVTTTCHGDFRDIVL